MITLGSRKYKNKFKGIHLPWTKWKLAMERMGLRTTFLNIHKCFTILPRVPLGSLMLWRNTFCRFHNMKINVIAEIKVFKFDHSPSFQKLEVSKCIIRWLWIKASLLVLLLSKGWEDSKNSWYRVCKQPSHVWHERVHREALAVWIQHTV